ncbi:hypothetical protein Dimus_037365, partial [Dionaea muscipula]
RQKWENLFKRRELVHVDAVKEFYAKMTVIHLKKKDVVKSKVKGVEIQFDHEKLAIILGIPGNNGICEYVKDVWEESKYIKPLEITKRFANNETLTATEGFEGQAEKEDERNKDDFDWEAVIDEVAVEGECGCGERIRKVSCLKFQAKFERKRANKFHDDLEKAKAENARLLALLHEPIKSAPLDFLA